MASFCRRTLMSRSTSIVCLLRLPYDCRLHNPAAANCLFRLWRRQLPVRLRCSKYRVDRSRAVPRSCRRRQRWRQLYRVRRRISVSKWRFVPHSCRQRDRPRSVAVRMSARLHGTRLLVAGTPHSTLRFFSTIQRLTENINTFQYY